MKNVIIETDENSQYDDEAKKLISQKIVLAHILVKTVDEFKGMKPKEVVNYIENGPYISRVPTEPGMTNISEVSGKRIVGMNTESGEINEGVIKFDILFYVRMKDGLSQIIINVEIQKDEPTSYKILNRAIFYVSRMISSQKEREFEGMNYDDIKEVISIWICLNMTSNSMSHYHLTKEDKLEVYDWKGNPNLINIVLLGVKDELHSQGEEYELHRLLATLLTDKLKAEEKLQILNEEFDIPIDEEIKEEVKIMCNLSEGIEERGYKRGNEAGYKRGDEAGYKRGSEAGYKRGNEAGYKRGTEVGYKRGKDEGRNEGIESVKKEMIINMYKKGYGVEVIKDVFDKDTDIIEAIIRENSENGMIFSI